MRTTSFQQPFWSVSTRAKGELRLGSRLGCLAAPGARRGRPVRSCLPQLDGIVGGEACLRTVHATDAFPQGWELTQLVAA